MWQGMDRRQFPRADYRCRVTVFKKGKKEELSTHTQNIGIGGICVVLKKKLDKFHPVELLLHLEDKLPAIRCDGRVVWVVKTKSIYDTGLEFISLAKKDSARIERIVEECLRKEETSSPSRPL
jgi:c-di-GMP-binding flagellar brake protein YcgR